MPSGTVTTIDDQTFSALLQHSTPKLRAFVRDLNLGEVRSAFGRPCTAEHGVSSTA